jgi:hypothetical protein
MRVHADASSIHPASLIKSTHFHTLWLTFPHPLRGPTCFPHAHAMIAGDSLRPTLTIQNVLCLSYTVYAFLFEQQQSPIEALSMGDARG